MKTLETILQEQETTIKELTSIQEFKSKIEELADLNDLPHTQAAINYWQKSGKDIDTLLRDGRDELERIVNQLLID